ncbi:MAG: hypothetical protein WBV46_14575 [Terriglobales bacterium]|jgi:hypothetical protein
MFNRAPAKRSLILIFAILSATASRGNAFDSSPSPAALQIQIYAALTGFWTGQLEYRDFQSDKHVALPTWLEVTAADGGKSLQFIYTYDDGPTKTVTEISTLTIDPAAHRYTVTSDRDHSSDTYQITTLDQGKNGRYQVSVTGTGTENDKPVDVRITIIIDRNLYRFTKETRPAGQDFHFRDGYTMTRRNPPAL